MSDVHPQGPNSLNFMQFFGKIWQNRMLAPPEGWRPHLDVLHKFDFFLTLKI